VITANWTAAAAAMKRVNRPSMIITAPMVSRKKSESCEDGEILSASGDASQHGCCLGLARQ
jgi:hypothetical protein